MDVKNLEREHGTGTAKSSEWTVTGSFGWALKRCWLCAADLCSVGTSLVGTTFRSNLLAKLETTIAAKLLDILFERQRHTNRRCRSHFNFLKCLRRPGELQYAPRSLEAPFGRKARMTPRRNHNYAKLYLPECMLRWQSSARKERTQQKSPQSESAPSSPSLSSALNQ